MAHQNNFPGPYPPGFYTYPPLHPGHPFHYSSSPQHPPVHQYQQPSAHPADSQPPMVEVKPEPSDKYESCQGNAAATNGCRSSRQRPNRRLDSPELIDLVDSPPPPPSDPLQSDPHYSSDKETLRDYISNMSSRRKQAPEELPSAVPEDSTSQSQTVSDEAPSVDLTCKGLSHPSATPDDSLLNPSGDHHSSNAQPVNGTADLTGDCTNDSVSLSSETPDTSLLSTSRDPDAQPDKGMDVWCPPFPETPDDSPPRPTEDELFPDPDKTSPVMSLVKWRPIGPPRVRALTSSVGGAADALVSLGNQSSKSASTQESSNQDQSSSKRGSTHKSSIRSSETELSEEPIVEYLVVEPDIDVAQTVEPEINVTQTVEPVPVENSITNIQNIVNQIRTPNYCIGSDADHSSKRCRKSRKRCRNRDRDYVKPRRRKRVRGTEKDESHREPYQKRMTRSFPITVVDKPPDDITVTPYGSDGMFYLHPRPFLKGFLFFPRKPILSCLMPERMVLTLRKSGDKEYSSIVPSSAPDFKVCYLEIRGREESGYDFHRVGDNTFRCPNFEFTFELVSTTLAEHLLKTAEFSDDEGQPEVSEEQRPLDPPPTSSVQPPPPCRGALLPPNKKHFITYFWPARAVEYEEDAASVDLDGPVTSFVGVSDLAAVDIVRLIVNKIVRETSPSFTMDIPVQLGHSSVSDNAINNSNCGNNINLPRDQTSDALPPQEFSNNPLPSNNLNGQQGSSNGYVAPYNSYGQQPPEDFSNNHLPNNNHRGQLIPPFPPCFSNSSNYTSPNNASYNCGNNNPPYGHPPDGLSPQGGSNNPYGQVMPGFPPYQGYSPYSIPQNGHLYQPSNAFFHQGNVNNRDYLSDVYQQRFTPRQTDPHQRHYNDVYQSTPRLPNPHGYLMGLYHHQPRAVDRWRHPNEGYHPSGEISCRTPLSTSGGHLIRGGMHGGNARKPTPSQVPLQAEVEAAVRASDIGGLKRLATRALRAGDAASARRATAHAAFLARDFPAVERALVLAWPEKHLKEAQGLWLATRYLREHPMRVNVPKTIPIAFRDRTPFPSWMRAIGERVLEEAFHDPQRHPHHFLEERTGFTKKGIDTWFKRRASMAAVARKCCAETAETQKSSAATTSS